jgi:hypothetical protein
MASTETTASWVTWATTAVLAATIIGFTLLGALMSITARFDDDADWNLHPALVLMAVGLGAIVGILVSVVVIASRGWRVPERFALVGLWLGALVLAFLGSAIAAAAAPGVGFLIAGAQLLLGGLGVLAALALALRATRRATSRP